MLTLGLFALSLIHLACTPVENTRTKTDHMLEQRVDSVLALMTLEEKIGQLTLLTSDMDQTGAFIRPEYKDDIKTGKVGAIFNAYGAKYTRELQEMAVNNTRLGIPLLFGYDVIHGHRTIFPMPLAEAASWDLERIERTAHIAAKEAAAEGLHWTFAPMVDVARDPRWGRMVEGSGEDPYLGSVIGAARVRGIQGNSLYDIETLAACMKHFAAYGAAQAGRDYHTVDISERTLREIYLPPFKAAIDAGVATVMTAFNEINGTPASASSYLFRDILRDEWGFNGFVVSDYTAIMELLYHGVAADTAHAAELALKAGVDMSMQDGFYQHSLANLVKEGRMSMQIIDEAVANVLRIKFQLGLFDDPYRYSNEEREKEWVMHPDFLQEAREMAQRSMVLLKNEKQQLPITQSNERIALIGPFAQNKRDLIGSWSAAGDWSKSVSLEEGLRQKWPNANIQVVEGVSIEGKNTSGIAKAVAAAKSADRVILALGEAYWMSGEAASRSELDLPGSQRQLAEAILATGKEVTVVLFSGRPLTIGWLDDQAAAILQAWFPGTMSGHAVADVLAGDYNPSAKLPVTFPRNVGQIPIFYNAKNTGRPFVEGMKYTSQYLDVPNTPLYAFGYGLSYTQFELSAPTLSQNTLKEGQNIELSIKLTNTGDRFGEEVVQLYVHDPVGSVTRPLKELKGFQKIGLEAGESQMISFQIDEQMLSFYRKDMSFGPEAGTYTLMIGNSSDNTQSISLNFMD